MGRLPLKAEAKSSTEGATQTTDHSPHQPHQRKGVDKRNKIGTTGPDFARRLHEARLAGKTWDEIQVEFDVYALTAQKILAKHGYTDGPKNVGRKQQEKWNRPCIRCGCTQTRLKGLFLCKQCRKLGREEYNAPDAMYAGYTTHGGHDAS